MRIEFGVYLLQKGTERMAKFTIQLPGFAPLTSFRRKYRDSKWVSPAIPHDASGLKRRMDAESLFNRHRGDVFALTCLELLLDASDDLQLTVRRQLAFVAGAEEAIGGEA